MSGKLVYSTATGKVTAEKSRDKDYSASSGPIKMRLETKGRGGKAVTVLFNLPFATADEAKAMMRDLQTGLGCGATFKNNAIELRGDWRERVEGYCAQREMKVLRAGG